jgi:5-methylcytosine-specific restriction enzyme A
MPQISRLCRCGAVVSGRCDRCSGGKQASREDYRKPKGERYPKGWDHLAAAYRADNPLCERCLEQGRTIVAVDVHHKVKVSDDRDLAMEWSNLMSVCRKCHWVLDRG